MILVAAGGVLKPNDWRLSGEERWRSVTLMRRTDQGQLRAVVVIGRKLKAQATSPD
jgi:hypothetical protein